MQHYQALLIYYGDDWVEDSDIPPELGGFDDNVSYEIEN